ncbi:MAG TPA: hypothetical protein VF816_17860 [Rhodocyclaceae bacterium]
MDANLFYGIFYTVAVVAVCAAWFHRCGRADRSREVRAFAKRTLRYAVPGFVLGLVLLTSDLGTPPAGLVAITACCGLLLYAAGWALVVADDNSLVLVNLTGRALLLADPRLAHFYALPAPQDHPPTALPPVFPRTCYVVEAAVAELGAKAGRTDLFMVDAVTTKDLGNAGLLVRRLVRLHAAGEG